MEFGTTEYVTFGVWVALGIVSLYNRRLWLIVLTATAFIPCLITFVIPEKGWSFMSTQPLDGFAVIQTRAIVIMVICRLLFLYMCRNTKDDCVVNNFIYSTLVINVVMGLSYAARITSGSKLFTPMGVASDLAGFVIMGLTGAYHLMRNGNFGGGASRNIRLNHHLRLDSFLLMFTALVYFMHPQLIWRLFPKNFKPSEVNVFLVEGTGGLVLASSLLNYQATHFAHQEDKKNVIYYRLLMNVALSVLFLVKHLGSTFLTKQVAILYFIGQGVMILNLVFALCPVGDFSLDSLKFWQREEEPGNTYQLRSSTTTTTSRVTRSAKKTR